MRNFARSVIGTVVAVALTSLPVNANTQTDDFRQQLVLAGDTSQIAKWDALTDAERAEFVAFLNIQVDEQEMMGSASEGTTLVKVPSRLRILPPVDGGGATQWTSTFERAWSYLGITYTSLKLTFVYVVQADQVTTSLSCVPSFTKIGRAHV